jgi:Txe/YoeB family toxin of Txe-Axe toxin-antitoxin module
MVTQRVPDKAVTLIQGTYQEFLCLHQARKPSITNEDWLENSQNNTWSGGRKSVDLQNLSNKCWSRRSDERAHAQSFRDRTGGDDDDDEKGVMLLMLIMMI